MQDFDNALDAMMAGSQTPRGALGRMEALATQIATLRAADSMRLDRARLIVFGADHGIARAGVTAQAPDATRAMLENAALGRLPATVFAAQNGMDVAAVNAGVRGAALDAPAVRALSIGSGTASFLDQPAMTMGQRDAALNHGIAIGAEGAWEAIAPGDVGVGNTSAAAVLAYKIMGVELATVVGRGAGLDGAGLVQKHAILAEAAARVPGRLDPKAALVEYGGFEIAMMVGAMLGAARARRVVLVDGLVASVAALIAAQLQPEARGAMVACHVSDEPGHRVVLDALGARPLLSLNIRLGAGTGAALAWPLVRAAAALLQAGEASGGRAAPEAPAP